MPSLTPLARDPAYVPPPPEEIKKALEIYFNRLPELKPKQYQAIEMFLDYIGKGKKPEITNIAKKCKMDSRTLTADLAYDGNFGLVLEMAINWAMKSILSLSFARISCQTIHQRNPDRWLLEMLMKWYAVMHHDDFRRHPPSPSLP